MYMLHYLIECLWNWRSSAFDRRKPRALTLRHKNAYIIRTGTPCQPHGQKYAKKTEPVLELSTPCKEDSSCRMNLGIQEQPGLSRRMDRIPVSLPRRPGFKPRLRDRLSCLTLLSLIFFAHSRKSLGQCFTFFHNGFLSDRFHFTNQPIMRLDIKKIKLSLCLTN
jgi:hypothetical protein